MINLSPHIQRVVPLAAGLVSVVLAGVIWMPLLRDGPVSAPVNPAAQTPQGPDATEVLAEGAQELLARPLFHITRRPPVEAAPVQPAAPAPVTLSLTGIVNDETDRIALLRLSNQPDLLRGRVGDSIGNWEIAEITETAVLVTNGDGEQQTISLSSANN